MDEAAEGLKTLLDGIENGSWVDIATGSLDIASSIASFGGPYGQIASVVLSFISMCIGLFGGTSGGQFFKEHYHQQFLKPSISIILKVLMFF